jgi:hypothetical protein
VISFRRLRQRYPFLIYPEGFSKAASLAVKFVGKVVVETCDCRDGLWTALENKKAYLNSCEGLVNVQLTTLQLYPSCFLSLMHATLEQPEGI